MASKQNLEENVAKSSDYEFACAPLPPPPFSDAAQSDIDTLRLDDLYFYEKIEAVLMLYQATMVKHMIELKEREGELMEHMVNLSNTLKSSIHSTANAATQSDLVAGENGENPNHNADQQAPQ